MVTAAVSKAEAGENLTGFDSSALRKTGPASITADVPSFYLGERGSTPWRGTATKQGDASVAEMALAPDSYSGDPGSSPGGGTQEHVAR